MNIDLNNFITPDEDDASSKIFFTRLDEMLTDAETLFGERDKEYSIIGIEFHQDGPQTIFPEGHKLIAIQLSFRALDNDAIACWQLAHETIHLLSPLGKQGANILEEGLATYFSRLYLQKKLGVGGQAPPGNYRQADELVTRLLLLNGNAVREMREHQPTISHITPDIIKIVCPNFPDDLAEKLCQRFVHV
ncbi:hypothetical protein EON83_00160 [bacterium]|nr:MAG: hypothetical protein EON83_00160 [bacterium]